MGNETSLTSSIRSIFGNVAQLYYGYNYFKLGAYYNVMSGFMVPMLNNFRASILLNPFLGASYYNFPLSSGFNRPYAALGTRNIFSSGQQSFFDLGDQNNGTGIQNVGNFGSLTSLNDSASLFDFSRSTSYDADKILSNLPKQKTTAARTTSSHKPSSESDDETRPEGMVLNKRGNGYGKPFLDKVKQIAQEINCNYRDLLALMASESGIDAHNVAKNGCTGLIMFHPKYSKATVGYTTEELGKMTPIQQLDSVKKFFIDAKNNAAKKDPAYKGRLTKGMLYALAYVPSWAHKQVLTKSGMPEYEQNKAFDANGDGQITREEMGARIDRFYVSDKSFIA